MPEEAALPASAHADRALEFRGGRHCARAALRALGASRLAVLRAEDRSPVWPDGFVGSITHTRRRRLGFCAAAVARSGAVSGIGVDVEWDEPLDAELFARIFTEVERSRAEARPAADAGLVGKLTFSAKEAFYKAQYPLTRTFLEFRDVEVTLDERAQGFVLTLLRDAGPLGRGRTFEGRYARQDGLIATGLTF